MSENTVNQRISKMLDHFAKGNKSAFAKSIGISNQSLGEIVGGRQNAPSFSALQKIALAYPSINLHWLVLGEEPMMELTDEDQAAVLESYANEVEERAPDLIEKGKMSAADVTPSTNNLWELRTSEEAARLAMVEATEQHIEAQRAVRKREQIGGVEEKIEISLTKTQAAQAAREADYVEAARNRIRAERVLLGFNTNSATEVYKLGKEEIPNSLYGGLLANRLRISSEAAEELVRSGKIRATYINGEGYRITELAVRFFLGEW